MKSTFPGYYRPTEPEFKSLWEKCTFVPDANVVLNFYRYTEKTREELFRVLEQDRVRNRLWIPYQAAFEYQRNRLNVISEKLGVFHQLKTALERALVDPIGKALEAETWHPFIDRTGVTDRIRTLFTEIEAEAQNGYDAYHPLLRQDPISDRIDDLFAGKVGPPSPPATGAGPTAKTLDQIYKEGKSRFDREIPPGYKDRGDKKEPDCYGDFVLWTQVIEYARANTSPIILITDDKKEDWWKKLSGETIGPRPELIQEMWIEARVQCWVYRPEQFLEHAKTYLERPVSAEAIQEVREVGQQTRKREGPVSVGDTHAKAVARQYLAARTCARDWLSNRGVECGSASQVASLLSENGVDSNTVTYYTELRKGYRRARDEPESITENDALIAQLEHLVVTAVLNRADNADGVDDN